MNARPLLIIAVLISASITTTLPAKEPLVTDRPDFTESGLVVGRSVLQLDARVARRIIDDGVDFLFGDGVSWRP
jgi:hypothetical protein